MRASTVMDSVVGFGPRDHLCLAFDDPVSFAANAKEFLADGLAQGLQVRYVSASPSAAIGDFREWLLDELAPDRADAVLIDSVGDSYGLGHVVSGREQVTAYADATSAALAAGFAGLRVAADVTPVVATSEQLDAFARYEHLIDRYMGRHPFSAMCGYNRTVLGADAVAELACMHPVSNAGTMFRWHAADPADKTYMGVESVEVVLAGEIDRSARTLFRKAVQRTDFAPGQPVVLDVADLDFVDHHAIEELDALGRQLQARIVLRNPGYVITRIAELMTLEFLGVAEPA